MLDYRTERVGGEKCQRRDNQNHADQQDDENQAVRGEGAGTRRDDLFRRQRAGQREHRDLHQEAPEQHHQAKRDVIKGRVGVESAEGGAVIRGGLRKGIEHLRKPVWPRIADAGESHLGHHRDSRRQQNDGRENQDEEHREFHLAAFDLFAQILRRAADHQARDEDGEHRHHQHPVQARPDAAEDDLANLHIHKRNQAAQRHKAVVHRVDGAA